MQESSKPISSDEKLYAAVGYLWILCLVPLMLKKDSAYAQFHAKQGLVLTVATFLFWVVKFFLLFIPFLGWLIIALGWLAIIVLALLGMVNALSGRWWEMPVLGAYAKKMNI